MVLLLGVAHNQPKDIRQTVDRGKIDFSLFITDSGNGAIFWLDLLLTNGHASELGFRLNIRFC